MAYEYKPLNSIASTIMDTQKCILRPSFIYSFRKLIRYQESIKMVNRFWDPVLTSCLFLSPVKLQAIFPKQHKSEK